MVDRSKGADSEILPRYIFLESLFAQGRVLEVDGVGVTDGRGARFLKERGAESVVAIDVDAAAVQRARREPALQGLELQAGDYLQLQAEPFDWVFLHRGERLIDEPDRLKALANLLKPRSGHLVVALRHPGGSALVSDGSQGAGEEGYRTLLSLLERSFRSIEIAVQTAFVGYAVTPASAQEVSTALDESLAEGALPAYHLFICGNEAVQIDTASLATLPSDVLTKAAAPPSAPPAPPGPQSLSLFNDLDSELQNQRVSELEARTQAALEEAARAELTLAQALAERDSLKSKLLAKGDADELEKTVRTLQADLEVARAEIAVAQGAVRSAQLEHERVDEKSARLEAEKTMLEQALSAKDAELASLEREAQSLREELGAIADASASERSERERLSEGLSRQETEGRRLRAELEAAQAEIGRLREAIAQSQAEVSRQAAARASAEQAILVAEERARQTELKLEAVSQAFEQRGSELDRRLTELNTREAELERTQADLARLGVDKEVAERALAEAKIKQAGLSAEVELAKLETDEIRTKLGALDEERTRAAAGKASQDDRIRALEAEIAAQKREIASLNEALDAMRKVGGSGTPEAGPGAPAPIA